MYTVAGINSTDLPKPTGFLKMKPLCGLCKFRCCREANLHVECSAEESKKLDLPILFSTAGGCRCLTDAGCRHGDDRPALCKLAPLQVLPSNQLVVGRWFVMCCPMASDYVFVHVEQEAGEDVYVYKRKDDISHVRKVNAHEYLRLKEPLEKFPSVLELCRDGLEAFYGDGAVERIQELQKRQSAPVGFGFNRGLSG